MRYRYTILYVALIVVVNWLFTVIDPVVLPGGNIWPPVSLVVGLVFVVRDFAQREIGHWVILAMLIGGGISYFMAGQQVATASVAAFLVSEFLDWAVYSFTKRPLSERILYSSLLGTPIDSTVFLYMAGFGSPVAVAIQTVSKLLGAVVVWWIIRRREQRVVA